MICGDKTQTRSDIDRYQDYYAPKMHDIVRHADIDTHAVTLVWERSEMSVYSQNTSRL